MRAIGYIRVSTEEQASEGVSLAAQRAKIAAWCQANDYTLVDVLTDAGLSGTRTDRPGLATALSTIGKGDAFVVYSLSRLSRSTKHTLELAERLDAAGADLVSLSERIDTTTAAGKMVFRLLAVLNEFERDQLAERTSAALQYKKRKGELVGAVPYGKALGADGKTLVDHPAEQQVLTEARTLHGTSLSLRQIAHALAAKGFVARNGKPFMATQIQRMVA
jgi:site-specific DNA recombinase